MWKSSTITVWCCFKAAKTTSKNVSSSSRGVAFRAHIQQLGDVQECASNLAMELAQNGAPAASRLAMEDADGAYAKPVREYGSRVGLSRTEYNLAIISFHVHRLPCSIPRIVFVSH